MYVGFYPNLWTSHREPFNKVPQLKWENLWKVQLISIICELHKSAHLEPNTTIRKVQWTKMKLFSLRINGKLTTWTFCPFGEISMMAAFLFSSCNTEADHCRYFVSSSVFQGTFPSSGQNFFLLWCPICYCLIFQK